MDDLGIAILGNHLSWDFLSQGGTPVPQISWNIPKSSKSVDHDLELETRLGDPPFWEPPHTHMGWVCLKIIKPPPISMDSNQFFPIRMAIFQE